MKENCCEDLIELLNQASVPRNTVIDERPFEQTDFARATELANQCFAILENDLSIGKELNINELNAVQLEYIYRTLLACGEHSSRTLWTNEECILRSERVFRKTLALLNVQDLTSFLIASDVKRQMHGTNLFLLIAPKLTKNEWKYHPAVVHCYCWLLRHINSQMGEFLNIILPVPLIIIDDYEIENKVIALRCLTHILQSVSIAELNWHVQVELLQSKIKPLFLYRETGLIVPLIECTLEIADKTKHRFIDVEDLQWGFMDDILNTLLPMMEYEQNMARRCAYSEGLNMILGRAKLSVVRWCSKIMRIVDDYSKTAITELLAIKALHHYTRNCWPFLEDHWRFINVVAGRVIYRSSNEEAIEIAEHIIRRLEYCITSSSKLKTIDYIRTKRKQNCRLK